MYRHFKFDTGLSDSYFKARSIKEAWDIVNRRYLSYKSGHVIGILYIEVEIPSNSNTTITHAWKPLFSAVTNKQLNKESLNIPIGDDN